MKNGAVLTMSFILAGLACPASASSPHPSISCSSVSPDTPSISSEAQAAARAIKGQVSRICNDRRNGQLVEFDVQMPSAYDPVGVCAYRVYHFRKVDGGGVVEWLAIDAGGQSNTSIFMRLSETCDGNGRFVRLIHVSTGSFIRMSILWNKLFSQERMDRFLATLGGQEDESVKPLISLLRAQARAGQPIAWGFIALEYRYGEPFPYFRVGFQDTGTFLLIDFDGEELGLLGWGWQS